MTKEAKAPKAPRTLREAVIYFSDRKRCLDYVVTRRWPKGVTCPTCGSTKVHFLANQERWKCSQKHDKRQFSAKVGTIFEESPIGFEKWLPAMWLLGSCKNGISSYELARDLGVTQRTAWFMLHRIRLAMQESGGKLGGPGSTVQVDETWIGGQARKMNARQRAKVKTSAKHGPYAVTGKAIVLGMLETGGRVRTRVVPDVQRSTLLPQVVKHVARGTDVHTDEHVAYEGLGAPDYTHDVVNHSETYVRDNVHVNGVENFWSLLKRMIRGTYVSVEPFHLFRYLDEQAFRFNTRKTSDSERFADVLAAAPGRRLTYKQLTGIASAAP